jgi:hypothetical protein
MHLKWKTKTGGMAQVLSACLTIRRPSVQLPVWKGKKKKRDSEAGSEQKHVSKICDTLSEK